MPAEFHKPFIIYAIFTRNILESSTNYITLIQQYMIVIFSIINVQLRIFFPHNKIFCLMLEERKGILFNIFFISVFFRSISQLAFS